MKAKEWRLTMSLRCGLGMTGLIVQVKLEVEPAFRLRESKVPVHIDYLLGTSLAEERLVKQSGLDGTSDEKTPLVVPAGDAHFVKQRNEQSMQKIEDVARSAEHVRMWWYPQTGGVIVARANRTYEVSLFFPSSIPNAMLINNCPSPCFSRLSKCPLCLATFSTITSRSSSSTSLPLCPDTHHWLASGRGG